MSSFTICNVPLGRLISHAIVVLLIIYAFLQMCLITFTLVSPKVFTTNHVHVPEMSKDTYIGLCKTFFNETSLAINTTLIDSLDTEAWPRPAFDLYYNSIRYTYSLEMYAPSYLKERAPTAMILLMTNMSSTVKEILAESFSHPFSHMQIQHNVGMTLWDRSIGTVVYSVVLAISCMWHMVKVYHIFCDFLASRSGVIPHAGQSLRRRLTARAINYAFPMMGTILGVVAFWLAAFFFTLSERNAVTDGLKPAFDISAEVRGLGFGFAVVYGVLLFVDVVVTMLVFPIVEYATEPTNYVAEVASETSFVSSEKTDFMC